MEHTPLTAQAINTEIAKIVGEVAANLPFADGIDYDFLQVLSIKALQIFWQEYALSCGSHAYAQWKEAAEAQDVVALGNWCNDYMEDEKDSSVFVRATEALSVARTEILARAEQEYTSYKKSLLQ
jgi:hypothetical protein